jgi:hypothetical protein
VSERALIFCRAEPAEGAVGLGKESTSRVTICLCRHHHLCPQPWFWQAHFGVPHSTYPLAG